MNRAIRAAVLAFQIQTKGQLLYLITSVEEKGSLKA